jgi:Fic family protein
MPWNWQLKEWPRFYYDAACIAEQERQFLLGLGSATAFLKTIEESEYYKFVIEILSQEGIESSKIEGEILERESLQSSIKKHFGLATHVKHIGKKESGMAHLLCDVYESFQKPLSNEILFKWHEMLFRDIRESGQYRTHSEPMQIVSNRLDVPKVFFEAPPSDRVPYEMDAFINWYNAIDQKSSVLGQAAIAHLYFESIHPFEDGNGRIGRVLIEKFFSRIIGRPILISVSRVLEKRKKEYYSALESCNRTLSAQSWVQFFSESVLQAQKDSMDIIQFLVAKSKLFSALTGKINIRQEKVLLRMFESGPLGFKGGLSAENYIAITKASRATTTRDLAELISLGALVKTGELRYTRYWLNLK